jgi:hypothetical protein
MPRIQPHEMRFFDIDYQICSVEMITIVEQNIGHTHHYSYILYTSVV